MTRGGARHVALVALMLALAGCGGSRDDVEDGGPVSTGPGNFRLVYGKVGEPFFFGTAVIHNDGERPVRLRRVILEDPTPGLRVTGESVAGNRRRWNTVGGGPTRLYDGSTTRAPQTDLHRLRGYELPPRSTPAGDRGAELIVDMLVDKPGRYAFKDLYVEYTAGEQRYRRRIRSAFVICVGENYDKVTKQPCKRLPIPP